MTAEKQYSVSKCPACGSTKLHSSRRRSALEKLSAFVGISYIRCHECKLRFSAYMGGFASRSMRAKYLLFKQRTQAVIAASVLFAIIVVALLWALNYIGVG